MWNRRSGMRKLIMASFVILLVVLGSVLCVTAVRAQADQTQPLTPKDPGNQKWAFLAAAISTGLGCLGAGIAVAYVGAAAVGAVAEKPQIAGRTLIFVGLAEGIAIYGLIIAIMILGKV